MTAPFRRICSPALPCAAATLLLPFAALDAAPPPVVPDDLPAKAEPQLPGVTLTLLAEHPQLVTPTGIDVDESGRVWLVACHTHFRPDGYQGPEQDEVLVFPPDGGELSVFACRTTATMNLQLGPGGWVYLAERSRILRLRDSTGDGKADQEETLARLDTLADYPHNGLSGMAWHPDGGLVFALGENFGKDWTLTGSDGATVSGRGEGGVFRCTPEGDGLRRIARGFWNPFGLHVRKDGSIFAAENDPGSRPPCRLIEVLEGADYGFQWVYGSAPVHPFVAWNGELRGTLGMVHPIGEGPCAVASLGGGVLVTSWSDHSIDYFPLHRQGAGHVSERIAVVKGSQFFRPVCMARGPDGTFYFTDWVFSSYSLHQRGRLWKMTVDPGAPWVKPAIDSHTPESLLAAALRENTNPAGAQVPRDLNGLLALARGSDRWLGDAALSALARLLADWEPSRLRELPTNDRLWCLVALRRGGLEDDRWVAALIDDSDPEIRFECLRWIADAVLTDHMPWVEEMLESPDLDFRLFEAALAAWNTLRGEPGAGVTHAETLLAKIRAPGSPARLRAYALRLAPPAHKELTADLLSSLLDEGDEALSREVVETLCARGDEGSLALLARVAGDEAADESLRAQAASGLGLSLEETHLALLEQLAAAPLPALQAEARRALRLSKRDKWFAPADSPPPLQDTGAWLARLDAVKEPPDAGAGRRLFFNRRIGQCANCHRHQGRGTVVGPDLTLLARQSDRAGILRSILEPQADVAPQFFPSLVKLRDGTEFTAILLRSSDREVFRMPDGTERQHPKTEILERVEIRASLMPAGLTLAMTDRELRDLLHFLTLDNTEAGGE